MLKKLFSRFFKSKPPVSTQTVPLDPGKLGQNSRLSNEIFNIEAFTAQSIGKVRTTNEDSVYSTILSYSSNHQQLNFGLFIVADGMGGHVNGEVASSLAVHTISAYLLDRLKPLLQVNPSTSTINQSLHELIHTAIKNAQDSILRSAPGAGTTVTLAMVLNNQLTIAQIGDSRCYLVQNKSKLKLLTRDHSLVTRLVEIGQVTPQEAINHPQKHILYKALGQKGSVEADIETFPLPKNCGLLICSDGLWGQTSDESMSLILQNDTKLSVAAEKLIDLANNAGGPDNISLILVMFT